MQKYLSTCFHSFFEKKLRVELLGHVASKFNFLRNCQNVFLSCNFTDFIYSKSSLVESLEFLINKVMSLENRYNFTSFFLIWMLFISLPV